MKALYATLTIAVVGLSGCATPRVAPRFNKPSTAALEQSNKAAVAHIEAAQRKVVIIEKDCPKAQAVIVALSRDLSGTLNELQSSEGARKQLDAQLKQQTDSANKLASEYDKAGVQIASLKVSRHRWVKLFTGASVIGLTGFVWIFKKPILLLLGL